MPLATFGWLLICTTVAMAQNSPNPTVSVCSSVWGIGLLLNILGGVLTIVVVEIYRIIRARVLRRKFRKVYGQCAHSCALVYGNLSLHPAIAQAVERDETLTPQARLRLKSFPLSKVGRTNELFSASSVVSASEIRAAAYISKAIGAATGITAQPTSDESVAATLDISFVSFGVKNNVKTLGFLGNPANDLLEFDMNAMRFVSKKSGKPVHPGATAEVDYGVITRISPQQFKTQTWLVCAGLGEWGTSGAAWFLANRWRELAKRVRSADASFAAVIRVTPGQDESALLESFAESPTDF